MKKQIRIYIYIIGLILIDQLSKVWALSALRGTEGIAVIPNVFELSYLENRGAAFGILQDHQIFFVVDFFYFKWIDFPVFNVADIYVTVTMILLLILILFFYKEEDLDFLNRKGKHGRDNRN